MTARKAADLRDVSNEALGNTTSTSSGDWAEASALFDSVIEMSPAGRAEALGRSTAATGVKDRVQAMIAALEASPGFLGQPPVLHGAVGRAGGDI